MSLTSKAPPGGGAGAIRAVIGLEIDMTHTLNEAEEGRESRLEYIADVAKTDPADPSPTDLVAIGLDMQTNPLDEPAVRFSMVKATSDQLLNMRVSETWARKCQELRQLNASRRVLRAQVKLYYRGLDKNAYTQLVARHTSVKQIWVPGAVTSTWDPGHKSWKTIHNVRWFSKLEWVSRQAQKPGVTLTQLKKYNRVIDYLLNHKEANDAKYRYTWVPEEDMRIPFKGPFDRDSGFREKIQRVKRSVPDRDWARIRQEWAAKCRRARSLSRPLTEKIRRISDSIRDCEAELRSSFNQYQLADRRMPIRRVPGHIFTDRAISFTGGGYRFNLPVYSWEGVDEIAGLIVTHDSYFEVVTPEELSRIDVRAYVKSSYTRERNCFFARPQPAFAGYLGELAEGMTSTSGPFGSWTQNFRTGEETYTVGAIPLPPVSTPCPWFTSYSSQALPNVVSCASDDDLARLYAERRLEALARLRNLRVGKHRSTGAFNVYRSIGELKDMPLLIRQSREFYQWCRSHTGHPALAIYFARGRTPRYLAASELSRYRFIKENLSSAQGRARLRRLGISRVVPLARIPALNIAAACYLAWKFGIEQSISDARTVIQEGKACFYGIRDGLRQYESEVLRKRGVATPRVRWSVSSPVRAKAAKPKPGQLETYDVDVPRRVVDIRFSWKEDLITLLRTGEHPTGPQLNSGHLYLRSDDGLYACYHPLNTDQPTEADVAELAWMNMQAAALQGMLPGPVRAAVRVVSGSVFSRVSYRDLMKAFTRSSRQVADSVRPFEVAWELAPLSFVVDWFTNIGKRIAVAQDLFDAAQAKLPARPAWETCHDELRILDPLISDQAGVSVTALGPSQYLVLNTRCTYDNDTGETEWVSVESKFYALDTNLRLVRPAQGIPNGIWAGDRLRSFTRRRSSGDLAIPDLRLRFNLNEGKVLSLLSMFIG